MQKESTHTASAAITAPGEIAWSDTRVVKTLWPPQSGTLGLKKRYGSQLVCVRYRQDPSGAYRYTTVELLIDHAVLRYQRSGKASYLLPILLPIPFWEHATRMKLLAQGAKWDHEEQAWAMSKATAIKLGVLQNTRRRKKVNAYQKQSNPPMPSPGG